MFKRIWYANPQAPNVPKTPEKTDRFYPLMIAPALAFVKEKCTFSAKFFIFRVIFNNINNKFNILEIEGWNHKVSDRNRGYREWELRS